MKPLVIIMVVLLAATCIGLAMAVEEEKPVNPYQAAIDTPYVITFDATAYRNATANSTENLFILAEYSASLEGFYNSPSLDNISLAPNSTFNSTVNGFSMYGEDFGWKIKEVPSAPINATSTTTLYTDSIETDFINPVIILSKKLDTTTDRVNYYLMFEETIEPQTVYWKIESTVTEEVTVSVGSGDTSISMTFEAGQKTTMWIKLIITEEE